LSALAGSAEPVATEPSISLDALLQEAEIAGFTRAQLVLAASHYHRKRQLEALAPDEIADLQRRLRARGTSSPDQASTTTRASPPAQAESRALDNRDEDEGSTEPTGSHRRTSDHGHMPTSSDAELAPAQRSHARHSSRNSHTHLASDTSDTSDTSH
jgi:hypothetical protein